MTTHPTRLHGLDTLRAAAVLAVIFYHLTIFGELPRRWLPVTGYGWMGVDLFFVLSGFLIGQQLLRPYRHGSRPALADFYRRRAWRILPAYLVVLALYRFVPAWRESPGLPPVWRFLTFTVNLGSDPHLHAFSQAWSLCVEEYFYLLMPMIAALAMRRPSARKTLLSLGCVVAGGIVLRWWLVVAYPDEVYRQVYYPTYCRLDGLTAGVALAILKTFRPTAWQQLLRHGHALTVGGLLGVADLLWLTRNQDLGSSEGPAAWALILGLPLLSLGWALLTASAMSENGLLARWRVPGARTLAMLAFSLYLTHKEVGHMLQAGLPSVTDAQGPASWCLYTAGCALAAAALYLGVERPFLRLRDRHAARKDAAVTAETLTNPAL